jgi:Uma2 family endonuclease
MVDQTVMQAGQEESIPATVTEAEYMERYAADGYEWVDGVLEKMSPNTLRHNKDVLYLEMLFEAYFSLNPIGVVAAHTIVMRLAELRRNREPDLMVILGDNQKNLTETFMNGAADIVIEIVSDESVSRDYEAKFSEYEGAGVGEYWLFHRARKTTLFYRRDEAGKFVLHSPDADGNYRTPLLPRFALHVPTLWEAKMPNIFELGERVRAMFRDPETDKEA